MVNVECRKDSYLILELFFVGPKHVVTMNKKYLHILSALFKCTCGIAAFFMVGFWIIKFHKNEDVSSIEYVSYDTPRDMIYPELSLCIQMPFTSQSILSDSNVSVSVKQYNSYLKGGAETLDEYKRIRYHNVTLDILEYVRLIGIYFRNEPTTENLSCTSVKNCSFVNFENNFNGFAKGYSMRCFGFKVQPTILENVEDLYVAFQPSLNDQIYKIQENIFGQIFLALNYPGQILRATGPWKPVWNAPKNSLGVLSITVSAVEILRRRNKYNDPCLEGGALFDHMVLKEHHDTVGCSPPYQTSDKPLCATRKQLNDSKYEITEMKSRYHKTIKRPCEELANIVFAADERQYSVEAFNDTLKFYYTYPEKIKVVQQIKSVDLHSLIGNIGGYIGLFLGNNH